MYDNILNVSDSASSTDLKRMLDNSHGKTFRTQILVGHDLYRDAKGRSQLGELVIKPQENKIVLGGMVYFLEQAFGVKPNYTITTLDNKLGIFDEQEIPTAVVEENKICLFNVGIDGCGSSFAEVNEVRDQQNSLGNNLVPFRVVNVGSTVSTISGGGPYWFKKTKTENINGVNVDKDWYYLKQFDTDPDTNESNVRIYSFWRDAAEGVDGTPVTDETLATGASRKDRIETCVELVMSITPTDLREYFEMHQESSVARFNSIGLCSGTKCEYADGSREYKDVRQITVLNFSNEMLHFDKGLTIVYRIYLS